MLSVLYVLVFVLTVLHLYFRFRYEGRTIAKVPGPFGVPLFGNLLHMWKTPVDIFKYMRDLRIEYGRIFQLSGAHVISAHVIHPEDVEKVLSVAHGHNKHIPYNFLYGWLGGGLLVSNDEKWFHRRRMLTPAFHFNILTKFFHTFSLHTQDLVDVLEQEVEKDKTDLIPLITSVTLRIMCETSLGTRIRHNSSVVKQYLDSIHKIGEIIVNRLCSPWLYVDPVYKVSPLIFKEKAVLPGLHKFTKDMIESRREFVRKNEEYQDFDDEEVYGKKSRPAMLDLLLNEEKKGNIDDAGIREEVDTFLFEGHDTIQTALSFMIMRIANEIEVQKKIHKEIDSIFGDSQRDITLKDLNNLKYLEYCIKESLRLYPSVPFINRRMVEDVELAGYTIPKNSYCDIHIYDVHRNPEVYPDPEKFIPERFLPENMATRHPYAYIPFSAGPRNCIGQKFALMEMKTLMCGILRRFQLEAVTKHDELEFTADLVLRTTHPLYVRFLKRT